MVWVRDLPRALDFYRQLGFVRIVEAPHYARLKAPQGESTLSLHLAEDARDDRSAVDATTLYLECDSGEALDTEYWRLHTAGVKFSQAPTDQPWRWREAHLRDPDGNALVLYFAGAMRLDPPWKVKES